MFSIFFPNVCLDHINRNKTKNNLRPQTDTMTLVTITSKSKINRIQEDIRNIEN